jgi:uncharacterized repeat protein (TIGR01451 family)
MSAKLNEFGRRRSRRWWVTGATLVAFASVVVVGVGAASARTDGMHKPLLGTHAVSGLTGAHLVVQRPHSVTRHVVAASLPGLVANPAIPHVRYLAAAIGSVGQGAGFEDNDADLDPANGTPPQPTDWNSFTPTWTGNAPYQTGTGSANGYTFYGLTDDSVTTSDTGFAGGVKEDDACPAVIGTKSPNKDDLARIYIAGKLGDDGHTYLMLSWIRIPQNTTSADAHVAFEFNQGTTACGTGGLVQRTAGDLLVVYDFSGGGTPAISVSRWITSGSCEVGSDTAPCWGTQQALSSSDAEAAVNTDSAVTDTAGPAGSTSVGKSEFGEAGIDLTAAIFNLTGNRTCERFGNAFAVSRSSGSSSTAQMMDLVGPVPVDLSNCASPTITTQASPTTPLTIGTSATVGDVATFHNGNSPSGSVTFTLYSDSSCTTATGIAGSGAIASGSASYSQSFNPSAPGTYYWKAVYAGDGNNNGFTTTCGDANEQITVGKASPTISTVASPTSPMTVGTAGTVGDVATFHGGSSPTGSVTFTLYSNNSCTTATGVTGSGTISGSSASYSQSFNPSAPGTYYWKAVYAGDDNNNGFTTTCGDANEQITVGKASPTITTVLSASTGFPGETVNDTSVLHNATGDASGSVTYTVYSDAACSLNPQTAGTKTVTAGSVPDSDGITFNDAGTFYWQAQYSGDSNNVSATSACTDEQLVIRPLGTIEIVKNTLGDDGTFQFTGSGSDESFGDFELTTAHNTAKQDFAVLPGTYDVAEGAKAGWALTGLSCSPGEGDFTNTVDINAGSAHLHVLSGGVVVCTFTNTKLATLIVVKNVDNSNGGGSLTSGDFSLHVAGNAVSFTNPGSAAGTTYADLLPGLYTVSETPVSGYNLSSITGCDNGGAAMLNAGQTVTCTLTNTSNAPPPPPPPAPPAPRVDVQITKSASPNPVSLGGPITWTMVVSNNGPNTATGVTVADPLPAGTSFVSVATSQGSCIGGALVSCQLGTMPVGTSATITLVTTATTTGTVTNTATTVANEQETNTANNSATATDLVKGAFVPPVKRVTYCTAVAVSPKTLFAGRTVVLTVHVAQHGKAVAGVRVRIKGSTIGMLTKPSNKKGVVKTRVKPKRAGIVTFAPVAQKSCKNPRIGVTGVFTPPVTG